jgi:hypothetical protein
MQNCSCLGVMYEISTQSGLIGCNSYFFILLCSRTQLCGKQFPFSSGKLSRWSRIYMLLHCCHCVHRSPSLDLILSQLNSFHIFTIYLRSLFNIIIPPVPRTPKWCVPSNFSTWHIVSFISHLILNLITVGNIRTWMKNKTCEVTYYVTVSFLLLH